MSIDLSIYNEAPKQLESEPFPELERLSRALDVARWDVDILSSGVFFHADERSTRFKQLYQELSELNRAANRVRKCLRERHPEVAQ